jgi:hypothetical protein
MQRQDENEALVKWKSRPRSDYLARMIMIIKMTYPSDRMRSSVHSFVSLDYEMAEL